MTRFFSQIQLWSRFWSLTLLIIMSHSIYLYRGNISFVIFICFVRGVCHYVYAKKAAVGLYCSRSAALPFGIYRYRVCLLILRHQQFHETVVGMIAHCRFVVENHGGTVFSRLSRPVMQHFDIKIPFLFHCQLTHLSSFCSFSHLSSKSASFLLFKSLMRKWVLPLIPSFGNSTTLALPP